MNATAMILILLFLGVVSVLNRVEFGRFD